jgi:hypothetical protein
MWLVAILKPGNTAPYLVRCRSRDDAEEKKDTAESQGLTAEVYHTATDDIFEAKRLLRARIAEDFGYKAAYSNFRNES